MDLIRSGDWMNEQGLQRWQVGDVEVTAVLESDTVFDGDFVRRHVIPDATPTNLQALPWLAPHWVDAAWDPRMVVQAFVLRSAGRVIVVDTCIGNDKTRKNPAFHKLQTPFLERLAAAIGGPSRGAHGDAGRESEHVHFVVCTHLHFDHVGWNTRWDGSRWVPTFPRARYLFARDEHDHWVGQGERHGYVMADSIRPVLDAGLVDLVGCDHAITSEVRLVPTPGHTPGHVSVAIHSRGARALVTGDAIHHPCQVAHPEWTGPADTDRARARATREALVAQVAADGALVLGTHFSAPAAGRIVRDATGCWLDPVPGR